jgi:glucokinase
MTTGEFMGIDLGGTNVRAGVVRERSITKLLSRKLDKTEAASEIIVQLFEVVDQLFQEKIEAIGIGVPGLVNQDTGIVFDVLNIPGWKDMPLRHLVEERYHVPVWVNNDANCFAVGEHHFGKGISDGTMVGLTIGTGLGSGIMINGRLYSGKYCGAGEFGMVDYLDHYIEYYASGQFFQNVHGVDGEQVFQKATAGDQKALRMYSEMGRHLGNAIKTILYALEVDLIVLGGSVRHAYPFFKDSMWERIHTFAYKEVTSKLRIELSDLENSGILGAAALHLNSLKK